MNKIKHIPNAGLCSFTDVWRLALKVFTYLHKSFLCSTMEQTRRSSIAIINIETSYANPIHQESMNGICDIFEKQKTSFLNTWSLDGICTCFNYFVVLCWEDWFNSLNCVLILCKQHCAGFQILFRFNKVVVKRSFFLILVRCSLYNVLCDCWNYFNPNIYNGFVFLE